MEDTMEPGVFWARITQIDPQDTFHYEQKIRKYLQDQPGSYEPLYTEDHFIQLIEQGVMNVWLYEEDGKELGILAFTFHMYTKNVKTVKIEFVSCRHFLKMMKLIEVLEDQALKGGFSYIEASAHPTIAEYAVKKLGFAAPAVYIRKPIAYERKN